ncbi:hypothetical protein FB567DRAFT_1619 [Paraphoma chrysanthemicola]|uniref:Secreted protein n=1 Tax=Paraphoma chrysanthemicola TaxID=798071 RepID=A0A8K0W3J8_9PLEO|nr:hypothetical protein FB567DRAFT_1619 [Paraphoma chrysanthemicola]
MRQCRAVRLFARLTFSALCPTVVKCRASSRLHLPEKNLFSLCGLFAHFASRRLIASAGSFRAALLVLQCLRPALIESMTVVAATCRKACLKDANGWRFARLCPGLSLYEHAAIRRA